MEWYNREPWVPWIDFRYEAPPGAVNPVPEVNLEPSERWTYAGVVVISDRETMDGEPAGFGLELDGESAKRPESATTGIEDDSIEGVLTFKEQTVYEIEKSSDKIQRLKGRLEKLEKDLASSESEKEKAYAFLKESEQSSPADEYNRTISQARYDKVVKAIDKLKKDKLETQMKLSEEEEKLIQEKKQYKYEQRTERKKQLDEYVLKGLKVILEHFNKVYDSDEINDKLFLNNRFANSVFARNVKYSDSPHIKMKIEVIVLKSFLDLFPERTQEQLTEYYERYQLSNDARYTVEYPLDSLGEFLSEPARILHDHHMRIVQSRVKFEMPDTVNLKLDGESLINVADIVHDVLRANKGVWENSTNRNTQAALKQILGNKNIRVRFYLDEDYGFSALAFLVEDPYTRTSRSEVELSQILFAETGLSEISNPAKVSRRVLFLLYHAVEVVSDSTLSTIDFLGKYYTGAELTPEGMEDFESDEAKKEDLETKYNVKRDKFRKNREVKYLIEREDASFLRNVKNFVSAYDEAISKIDIRELMRAAVSCLPYGEGEFEWPELPELPRWNIDLSWEWPDILDWLERIRDKVEDAVKEALDKALVDIMKELVRLLEEGCRDALDYGKRRLIEYMTKKANQADAYVENKYEETTGLDYADLLLLMYDPEYLKERTKNRLAGYVLGPVIERANKLDDDIEQWLDDLSDSLNPTQAYNALNGNATNETAEKAYILLSRYPDIRELLNAPWKCSAYLKALFDFYVAKDKLVELEEEIERTNETAIANMSAKKKHVCGDSDFLYRKAALYEKKGFSSAEANSLAKLDLDENKKLIGKYLGILRNPEKLFTEMPSLAERRNADGSVTSGVVTTTEPEVMFSVEKTMKNTMEYLVREVQQDVRSYFNATCSLSNPEEILAIFTRQSVYLNVAIRKIFREAIESALQATSIIRHIQSNYVVFKALGVGVGIPLKMLETSGRVYVDGEAFAVEMKLSEDTKEALASKAPERIREVDNKAFAEKYFGFVASQAWSAVVQDMKLEQYYSDNVYRKIYQDLVLFVLSRVKYSIKEEARLIEVRRGDSLTDLLTADKQRLLIEYQDYLGQTETYNIDNDDYAIKDIVKTLFGEYSKTPPPLANPSAFDHSMAAAVLVLYIRSLIAEVWWRTLPINRVFRASDVIFVKDIANKAKRLGEESNVRYYASEVLRLVYATSATEKYEVEELVKKLWQPTIEALEDMQDLRPSSFVRQFFYGLPVLDAIGTGAQVGSRLLSDKEVEDVRFAPIFTSPESSLTNGQLVWETYVRARETGFDDERVYNLKEFMELAKQVDVEAIYDVLKLGVRLVYIPPIDEKDYDFSALRQRDGFETAAQRERMYVVEEVAHILSRDALNNETVRDITIEFFPIALLVFEEDVTKEQLLQHGEKPLQHFEAKILNDVAWKELFEYCFPLESILAAYAKYVAMKDVELYGEFERSREASEKLFRVYTEEAGGKEVLEYIEKNR